MFFPTITEFVENLIQIGRGLERSSSAFRFDSKNIYVATFKNDANKGRMFKENAMCDENSKAAFMQMRIATHAELLGVSRENSTIHNEIHWGILKLSCQ